MLGFGQPRCALKVGPTRVSWVKLGTDWRGRTRADWRTADLPPGLLTPSPLEPNVRDLNAFASSLRDVIGATAGRRTAPQPIALVLPDLSVRMRLVDVDRLPDKPAERDAFVRWRLEQDTAVPMSDARLAFQRLGPRTVLAAVIGEQVLQQYETVCEHVGLMPVAVSVPSLVLSQAVRQSSVAEPAGWLSLLDDGFTLLLHRDGRLAFLRSKRQSGHVLDDLAASLAVEADAREEALLTRLYVLSDAAQIDVTTAIAKELEVEVVPVEQTLVEKTWRVALVEPVPSDVLPAIAAIARPRRPADSLLNLSRNGRGYLSWAGAALALLCLFLTGWIAWQVKGFGVLRDQARDSEQALARIMEQDRRIQDRARREGLDVSDAALARLPGAVAFANELIAKRAFSWTRFLGDLEETVPPQVSINTIRPTFKDAVVTLSGSARSLKELTAFIISLEDHRAFKDARLLQHQVQDNGIVDFSVTVRYQSQARRT